MTWSMISLLSVTVLLTVSSASYYIPKGGSCIHKEATCAPSTTCAGTYTHKICVIPMTVGNSCGKDPYWVCAQGLDCVGNVCEIPKVPVQGDCSATDSQCIEGSVCAGKSGRRCVTPSSEGNRCSRSPFSICVEGLECRNRRCSKPIVPKGGSCLDSSSMCTGGTVCAGIPSRKICVEPKGEEQSCGRDPYWVCEEGLDCQANICRTPIVPLQGDCTQNESECVNGTVCSGTTTRKLCVEPMGEGQSCGSDPFWVCKEGLDCNGNICRVPLIPLRGDCTATGSVCVVGSVCAGTETRKVCVEPMGEGKSCGSDPYWVCGADLKCQNHICVGNDNSEGGEGDDCSGMRCHASLYCASRDWGRRHECVKYAGEGDHCGRFTRCSRGLSCRHGKCAKLTYRRW